MLVVLRLPHLVLAYVGRDHRLRQRSVPEIVDHMRSVEMAIVWRVLDVEDGRIAFHAVDGAAAIRAPSRVRIRSKSWSGAEARSPINDTCTATFLLISEGSMSI